jgi:fatty acid desaturase
MRYTLLVDAILGNLTIAATCLSLDWAAGTTRMFTHKVAIGWVAFLSNLINIFTYCLTRHWQSRVSKSARQRVPAGNVVAKTAAGATGSTPNVGAAVPVGSTRRRPFHELASPAELQRPTVAWPTVLIAVVSVGCWAACVVGGALGCVPSASAFAGACVATFVAFTPMHDAVHNAVCSRNARLNDLVGTVASLPFVGLFRLFKVVHLMHHRHANDQSSAPDGSSLDPDHWAGDGAQWQLPLRWATVFLCATIAPPSFFWFCTFILAKGRVQCNRPNARLLTATRMVQSRDLVNHKNCSAPSPTFPTGSFQFSRQSTCFLLSRLAIAVGNALLRLHHVEGQCECCRGIAALTI